MRWINCRKKNRNILIEYGLNASALLKLNRNISENALDNPVLTVGSIVNDFIGWGMPDAEKMPEYIRMANIIPANSAFIIK